MKKSFTVSLILVFVLAAVTGLGWFWLSRNMDTLVKEAIQSYGSSITQAPVRVGGVKLSPKDGRGSISQLVVGSPPGFKATHTLKVNQIDLEMDMATVTQDVVVIRHIAIVAPDVVYEKGVQSTNFDAISNNIAKTIGTSTGSDNTKARKFIVEKLIIQNAKAQASAPFLEGKTVAVTLPDITLINLGRAKGGITPGELAQEVTSALKSRLVASIGFDRLMQSGAKALNQAGSTLKNLFK